MPRHPDDLEELIADRAATNPDFAAMVEQALARRQLLRQLAEDRQAEGLTRTTVAARMGTPESAVARLEGGETDTKLSTLARYAAALAGGSNGESWTSTRHGARDGQRQGHGSQRG